MGTHQTTMSLPIYSKSEQYPPPTSVAVPTAQAPAYTTIRITYPQGVAYRRSASYNDRVQNVMGPTPGTQLTGRLCHADVQYLEIQNQQGGHVYIPLTMTNGTQLAQIVPQQTQVQYAQPQYTQPQTQYVQSLPAPNPQMSQVLRGDVRRVRRGYGGGCHGGYRSSSSDDCNYSYGRRRYGGGC